MSQKRDAHQGFLTRLLRNRAGNVMAMTAAALIPLLGLVGGGIDLSRLYLVKTRLQQACDAGALSGRKQMAGGAWSANSGKANTVATNMFNANFQSGSYGTSGLTKSFTESAGKVTGTASVQVPMTIMKVFGQSTKTLSVNCDAEMRIPNTDVMFVLDVTGSMAQTNTGDSDTKINGLKKAVRCFYETLAKIDTIADCGSTPSGNSGNAQLRFGFVPYSSNVNVGRLLKNEWMADSWHYQSRVPNMYAPGTPSAGTPYDETDYFGSSRSCNNWANGDRTTGLPSDSAAPQPSFTATIYTYTRVSYNSRNGECIRHVTPSTTTYTYTPDGSGSFFFNWTYKRVDDFPINTLKLGGSNWGNSLNLRVGDSGTWATVNWDGCIEERSTAYHTSFSPIPADAVDLDIDTVPTGNQDTQWKPALNDAIWGRASGGSYTTADVYTNQNDGSWSGPVIDSSSACPAPARKLQVYSTSTDFDSYVSTLYPTGNTYHDIGLVWGARLISPTGLFASENAFTPQGGEIQRHIIFMTDGDACTGVTNYTAYGLNGWDRRTTDPASWPTDGCTATGTLTQQVNMRFLALCEAIKNKNITLWVVSFGQGVSGTAATNLQTCASPNRFYSASNTADLLANFQQIASQISQLRLTS